MRVAGIPTCGETRGDEHQNVLTKRYNKVHSRSHDAVIRVYDDAGNVIGTHEHAGDFKELFQAGGNGALPSALVLKSSHNPRQNKTVVSFAPHSLNSRRTDAPICRDDVQQPAHALDIGVIAIWIQ